MPCAKSIVVIEYRPCQNNAIEAPVYPGAYPEAQIYLKIGDTEIDLFGSYETGFREDDSNAVAWPIPNVLGIKQRVSAVIALRSQGEKKKHDAGI